jgi:hypothetical protein
LPRARPERPEPRPQWFRDANRWPRPCYEIEWASEWILYGFKRYAWIQLGGSALAIAGFVAFLQPYLAAPQDPFRLKEISAAQLIVSGPDGDFSAGGAKRTALERLVELRVALDRADLRGADLTGAELRRASLASARISNADLRDADLAGANLVGADLHGSNLRGTSLYKSNLYKVDLSLADLRGADLRLANMSGAYLAEARMRAADLRRSQSLGCPQLHQATEWWSAYRSPNLACGRSIPAPPPHH